MAKLTKRQKLIAEKVEAGKVYGFGEALEILASLPKSNFRESVDVAVNLGIDARKSDQGVRSSTVLPHGTGKTMRVAVFTQGNNADVAREAGADEVESDDDGHAIYTEAGDLHSVVSALTEALGKEPESAKLIFKPKEPMVVDKDGAEKLMRLIDNLEDNDDVQTVFGNYDIPADVMEALADA